MDASSPTLYPEHETRRGEDDEKRGKGDNKVEREKERKREGEGRDKEEEKIRHIEVFDAVASIECSIIFLMLNILHFAEQSNHLTMKEPFKTQNYKYKHHQHHQCSYRDDQHNLCQALREKHSIEVKFQGTGTMKNIPAIKVYPSCSGNQHVSQELIESHQSADKVILYLDA